MTDAASGSRLAVLRERAFALLFSAQLISTIGDVMASVAVPFAIIELGGGAADIGLGVLEGEVFLPGDVLQHAQGLGHHLGANVVSSKDGELKCRHMSG